MSERYSIAHIRYRAIIAVKRRVHGRRRPHFVLIFACDTPRTLLRLAPVEQRRFPFSVSYLLLAFDRNLYAEWSTRVEKTRELMTVDREEQAKLLKLVECYRQKSKQNVMLIQ